MNILKKIGEGNNSLKGEFCVIWKFFYNNAFAYILLYIQNYLINRYMPLESLGQFSYMQSLLVLFASMYSMEVYSAYLRFVGINNEESLRKLIRRILIIASALFGITILAFLESPFYILFVGYMWMRERMFFFRAKLDITTYGRIKMIQYLFSILALIILFNMNILDHETLLLAMGMSYVLVSIVYTFNDKARRITQTEDFLPLINNKEIVNYALPLSFNAIVVWLLGAADQMLIDKYIDSLTLTYYSVAFRIIGVIRIGVSVIMEYWPRFYFERMEAKDYDAVKTMKKIFLLFITILCLGTVFLSKYIYIIMGASEYVDMCWMFMYLALAEMFRQWGAVLITFQSFLKNTSINIVSLSLLGIIKFITNYLIIESVGVNILLYSTLICYACYFCIALYYGSYREMRYMRED